MRFGECVLNGHTLGMTDLDLDDSWRRLEWVHELVDRIGPAVAAIDLQARKGALNFDTRVLGEFEHARYTLAGALEVPPDLGFVISDIAVNARSCLDMAITSIAAAYKLPIKNPQFPIENNIEVRQEDRTRQLMEALPADFRDVLTELQPNYNTPWGYVDRPVNWTALMIRAISNANKHRNLTPVTRTPGSRGMTLVDGLDVEMLSPADASPWPDDDATVLEVRYPIGAASDKQLAQMRPHRNVRLMIHQTGFKYDWLDLEFPVAASEFLDLTPKYVHHALTVFEQTHQHIQAPGSGFFRNFNKSL